MAQTTIAGTFITGDSVTASQIASNAITNAELATTAITGQTAETSIAGDDVVLIYDTSASAFRKMTRTNFVAGIGGTTVNGTTDNAVLTYINSSSEFTAESNLTFNGNTLSLSGDAVIQNGYGLVIGHTGFPANSDNLGGVGGEFTMIGAAGGDTGIHIIRHAADAGGGAVRMGKSRNATVGSHTVVANNDTLGEIAFYGDDGTDIVPMAAQIRARVDGSPASNNMPGRIEFSTTTNSDAPTERMRISSSGEVTVQENNSMPSVTQGIAKSWLSYDWSGGTPTIMDSYNVTSLDDMATGHIRINFDVAFENNHYAIVGMPSATRATMNCSTLTASNAQIKIWNSSDSLADIDGAVVICGEAT